MHNPGMGRPSGTSEAPSRAKEGVFFTSDTHYGHDRVIEYSKRPFKNADEMDEDLIQRWNAVVAPGDRVYHLGDVSFHRGPVRGGSDRTANILRRLNGQKFLVLGNHDQRRLSLLEPFFVWMRDLTEIRVDISSRRATGARVVQPIVLCHYAMRTWSKSHYGAWQLHGHSHGSLKEDPNLLQCDVGVDCWDYTPVGFEALRQKMAKKVFKPVDHHGAD